MPDAPPTTSFATLTLAPAIDCTVALNHPLTPGEVHQVVEETVRPGGKGINVAKVLASRGCRVAAGGFLGQDNAAPFERLLTQMSIQDLFVRVPGETRRNLMIVDGAREYKINRQSFTELPYEEAFVRGAVIQLVVNAEVVALCGSLPKRFPSDTYARIVRVLRAMGKAVVLDTSGEALREGVVFKPTIIKPNRNECEYLLGRRLSSVDDFRGACAELLLRHEVVIISDGASGAWFAQGNRIIQVTSPKVNVVDTTAAGDVLLAEFCAGFFPSRALTPELAARAVAAGSASVEMAGSVCPPHERVETLAPQAIMAEYAILPH